MVKQGSTIVIVETEENLDAIEEDTTELGKDGEVGTLWINLGSMFRM